MQRDLTDACFTDIAQALMLQAGDGGPIDGLQLAVIPQNPIPAIAHYVPLVIAAARNNPSLVALANNQNKLNTLAAAISICIVAVVKMGKSVKPPVTEFDAGTTESTKASSSSVSCPPKSIAPDCDNCGGNSATTSICDGVKTANYHYKGCLCYTADSDAFNPFDEADFKKYQKLLKNVGTMPASVTREQPPTDTQTGSPHPTKGIPDSGRYAILVTSSQGPDGKGRDGKSIWFRWVIIFRHL